MSYKKILKRCASVREHLSELPDIRSYAMTLTMSTKWNPEEELQHELDSLLVEASSYESMDASLFAHLENLYKLYKHNYEERDSDRIDEELTKEYLEVAYFKYPVLVWIYLRLLQSVTYIFAKSSFIFYIATHLPDNSFWRPMRPKIDDTEINHILDENLPSPFKKYALLGMVGYLEGETIDPLHKQVLAYYFSEQKLQIIKMEYLIEKIMNKPDIPTINAGLFHTFLSGIPEANQRAITDQLPTELRHFYYDMYILQHLEDLSKYPLFQDEFVTWSTEAVPNLLIRLHNTHNTRHKIASRYLVFIVGRLMYRCSTSEIAEISKQLRIKITKEELKGIGEEICNIGASYLNFANRESFDVSQDFTLSLCRLKMYFKPSDPNTLWYAHPDTHRTWKTDILLREKIIELYDESKKARMMILEIAFSDCNVDRMKDFANRESFDVSQIFDGIVFQAGMPRDGNLALGMCCGIMCDTVLGDYVLAEDGADKLLGCYELICQYLKEIPPEDWEKSTLKALTAVSFLEGINPVAKLWADMEADTPGVIMKMLVQYGNLQALKYVVEELNYDLKLLDPIWVANIEITSIKEYIIHKVTSNMCEKRAIH